jgi:catechol 2,3-dioxygenase-like lactoylglutathione lyase family enzyme
MTLQQPEIDHVVITVGATLDAAKACFERLGFFLTERGHHTLGSSNHLAILGTDYIELLGFEPGRVVTRTDLTTLPLGLTGIAFKTRDADATHDALLRQGFSAEAPRAFSRPVTTSGGVGEARFRTVAVPPGVIPNGRAFFCEHATPDLVWRDEWRRHDNGAIGIAEIVIATHDAPRAVAPLTKLFGAEHLTTIDGGMALRAGSASILFLTYEAAAERFGGGMSEPKDGTDRMVALALRVRSPDRARVMLKHNAVPLVTLPDRVVVPAAAAMGVAIAFLV